MKGNSTVLTGNRPRRSCCGYGLKVAEFKAVAVECKHFFLSRTVHGQGSDEKVHKGSKKELSRCKDQLEETKTSCRSWTGSSKETLRKQISGRMSCFTDTYLYIGATTCCLNSCPW